MHLICINIGQVMEHVLAEVRRHLLRLLEASMQLLRFVERVVAAEGLALTLSVLLKKQG